MFASLTKVALDGLALNMVTSREGDPRACTAAKSAPVWNSVSAQRMACTDVEREGQAIGSGHGSPLGAVTVDNGHGSAR